MPYDDMIIENFEDNKDARIFIHDNIKNCWYYIGIKSFYDKPKKEIEKLYPSNSRFWDDYNFYQQMK